MNKGLAIRDNKLKKQREKRNAVKENQKGLVRFVSVKWQVIERVNGKYCSTGQDSGYGLQIENKIYFEDGHFKFVNSKNLKITEIYTGIPEWASEKLAAMYGSNKMLREKEIDKLEK